MREVMSLWGRLSERVDDELYAELFDESDAAVLDAIGQIVGTARRLSSCSMGWWVGPSSPT